MPFPWLNLLFRGNLILGPEDRWCRWLIVPSLEREGMTNYEPLALAGIRIFQWEHMHTAGSKPTVRVGERVVYVLGPLGMLTIIETIT